MRRRDPARQPQRTRARMRRSKQHIVEMPCAQFQHQNEFVPIDRCSASVRAGGVWPWRRRTPRPGRDAFEHLPVIGVHQRGDVRTRITPAQGADQRRGANQVTDIVAADDEKFSAAGESGRLTARQGIVAVASKPGPIHDCLAFRYPVYICPARSAAPGKYRQGDGKRCRLWRPSRGLVGCCCPKTARSLGFVRKIHRRHLATVR